MNLQAGRQRRGSGRFWTGLVLALVLGISMPARAADPFRRGIDPLPHKLGATSDAFLTVEGARTAPARSYQLWLGADLAAGLLGMRLGDADRGALLEHRLDLHLLGSYSFTNWLEVGFDLPVTAYQANGFAALRAESGFSDRAPASAGLGDVRALAKLRLLQEGPAPIGLAAIAEVRAPTGASDDFLGEQGWVLAPSAVVEKTIGESVRLAFEAGYRARTEAGQYLNLYVGDELSFGLATSYLLPGSLADGKWTAFGEVLASTQARAPFNSALSDAVKTPLEGLVGLRGDLGSGFHALAGGGTGLGTGAGYGGESWRLFAGIGYRKIFQDRDGDGIEDHLDQCPDEPEDFDGFEDEDGCPDPDNDGDGIPDHLDACPDDPGPAEYDGCPDSDGDEIPDHEDACPDEPGPAQNDGCPADDPLVLYEGGKISLRGSVNFDTGRASIQRDSFEILDQVTALLQANPNVRRVRIGGHTDSVGSHRFNLDLSRRRAAAVVDYLVSRGVARSRLESAGFGPDRPVADNASALGRAKNRRVEFTILEMEGS